MPCIYRLCNKFITKASKEENVIDMRNTADAAVCLLDNPSSMMMNFY